MSCWGYFSNPKCLVGTIAQKKLLIHPSNCFQVWTGKITEVQQLESNSFQTQRSEGIYATKLQHDERHTCIFHQAESSMIKATQSMQSHQRLNTWAQNPKCMNNAFANFNAKGQRNQCFSLETSYLFKGQNNVHVYLMLINSLDHNWGFWTKAQKITFGFFVQSKLRTTTRQNYLKILKGFELQNAARQLSLRQQCPNVVGLSVNFSSAPHWAVQATLRFKFSIFTRITSCIVGGVGVVVVLPMLSSLVCVFLW